MQRIFVSVHAGTIIVPLRYFLKKYSFKQLYYFLKKNSTTRTRVLWILAF